MDMYLLCEKCIGLYIYHEEGIDVVVHSHASLSCSRWHIGWIIILIAFRARIAV